MMCIKNAKRLFLTQTQGCSCQAIIECQSHKCPGITSLHNSNKDKTQDGWRGQPVVCLSSGFGLIILCSINCISSLQRRVACGFHYHPIQLLPSNVSAQDPSATWQPGHFAFLLNKQKCLFLLFVTVLHYSQLLWITPINPISVIYSVWDQEGITDWSAYPVL